MNTYHKEVDGPFEQCGRVDSRAIEKLGFPSDAYEIYMLLATTSRKDMLNMLDTCTLGAWPKTWLHAYGLALLWHHEINKK